MKSIVRPLAAALMLALALSSASAKSIPDLVKDLAQRNSTVRVAAYRALLALKSPAVIGPLGAAMPDLDQTGRTYARIILDALPIERTRGLFRSLLRADDPDLRALAASSLFRKGDPSGIEIATRIIRNVQLEDAVAYRVMVRMAYVRHPSVSAAVRERLLSPASASLTRYLMLHVNYVADAEAVPALRRLTASKDLEIRLRARALLYRFGSMEVLPGLAADLADPKGTYLALIETITLMGHGPKPPEIIAKALLTRLDGEGQPLIVSRILDTLAAWKYRPALEIAKAYVDDPDVRIARSAFGLIAKLAGRPQLDALRRSLESKTPVIRVLAAEALRRYDDLGGLDVAIAVLDVTDVAARREAARVLGDFRVRGAIPPLIDALEDADPTVRTHAWLGLSRTLPALFPYRRFSLVSLGYTANGPAAERAKAVTILRAWWAALPK